MDSRRIRVYSHSKPYTTQKYERRNDALNQFPVPTLPARGQGKLIGKLGGGIMSSVPAPCHAAELQAQAIKASLPSSKKCSRCKKTKQRADFAKNKTKPDGLRSSCKCCHRSQDKASRAGELRNTKRSGWNELGSLQ